MIINFQENLFLTTILNIDIIYFNKIYSLVLYCNNIILNLTIFITICDTMAECNHTIMIVISNAYLFSFVLL